MIAVLNDVQTLGQLLKRLGGVSPDRVRTKPALGEATEADVLAVLRREKKLCELVDGVLVEKVMGYSESLIAVTLIRELDGFVTNRDLGLVAGEAGMLRLAPGLVRIPDVSFVSWRQLPDREPPAKPIPNLAPDLAVEVLSQGNTEEEMERKLSEYFQAGTRLVWFVEPATRTVRVYTSPRRRVLLKEDENLTGGKVLPGFSLPLSELFAKLGKRRRR